MIKSLQQTLEADRAEKKILQEKIDYLIKKLFEDVPSRDEVIPPSKGEAVNIYRQTYKCPACSAENIKFVKAYKPEALIPNSYTSESAVAWVMYQ